MNSIVKKAACLMAACAMAVGLASCGGGSNAKTPAPSDITASVLKQVKFAETQEITQARIDKFYEVDTSTIDKMSAFLSTSDGSADEVVVFEAKNADDAAKIKTAVDARVTDRENTYKAYSQSEYSKLQKSAVEVRGNYVFIAVCSDSAKAKSVFDGFFK